MHIYKCSSLPLKSTFRLKHVPFVPAVSEYLTPNCPCNMLYCHHPLPATVGGNCHTLSDHGSVMLHSAACSFYDILSLYLLLASVFWIAPDFLIFTGLVAFHSSHVFSLFCFPLFVALRLHLSLLPPCPPLSAITVVSTLQYKVSTPPTHPDTPPEYKQYRASTLPPSYVRVASASPPSSSSSPCQEREVGAARDKAQLSSQLSTSLASAFSPVQAGVNTQGRQVRQIPLSPPTAARHLHHQQQLQQQDILLPPKHGTWSASHLQQMYNQAPPASSSPPVLMAMPVKQGMPPQPILPMAHPLPPLNPRMKPPPLDPNTVTGPHQYSQHQAHPQSNGTPDDSYTPHSHHLPLTPQYCEPIPLPPLAGQSAPGPVPCHHPQYASTFHPQQQQQTPQQQQQVYYQQAQPPTTSSSSSSPPSYTAMSDGGSPKKTPSPIPQQAYVASSSKYEEERGGVSQEKPVYICVCLCVYLCGWRGEGGSVCVGPVIAQQR